MGMVDYFRLPKRQWYWYRNEYLHIPPPAWPSNGIPAALKLTADKTTLKSVDGTDDAQLIVTVVDKDGKAISNCPPVTLAIESGPGEFPTGPSITFAPDSDIAIRDGQAAMEFRSYYAGKTVIRATSPGLKDATITNHFAGRTEIHRRQNAAGETASVCAFHRSAAQAVHGSRSAWTIRRAPAAKRPATADAWPTTAMPPPSGRRTAGDTNAWLQH